MKALIIAASGFEDSELLVPMHRLKEEGFKVDVATPMGEKISGKHGYEVAGTANLAQVRPDDYDVLVIPGGRSPETVRLEEQAVACTRAMIDKDKIVAVICHGAQVLISAGAVKGRKLTCWKGIRDDVKAAGGNYRDEEVVVDGNLVTSRMPEDLGAFCREMMKLVRQRKLVPER
jgi:protease I